MSFRILLVEDEASIRDPLAEHLRREGFVVSPCEAVATAVALFAGHDLAIVDWMLPDGQGVDLLRVWRGQRMTQPVIFLTARADLIDKIVALELGADDYVTKPFEPRELVARIKVRLRAAHPAGIAYEVSRGLFSEAGISLDSRARAATFNGIPIDLTRMEFDLLAQFLANPGVVFSRDELLNKVWGYDSYPTTRTVDTHVLQLRQKTAPELFETVRGIGYRFRADKI